MIKHPLPDQDQGIATRGIDLTVGQERDIRGGNLETPDRGTATTIPSLVLGKDTLIEIDPETGRGIVPEEDQEIDPRTDLETDHEIVPEGETLETLSMKVVARAVERKDLTRMVEIDPSHGRRGLQHPDPLADLINNVVTTATDLDTSLGNAETRLFVFNQIAVSIP